MRAVRSAFLGLMLSATARGQTRQLAPSPSDLLERVRTQFMSEITLQSRYTCVQNITRRVYGADSKSPSSCSDIIARDTVRKHASRLISLDHLQLDVAIAENREIHSWPGASKFDEEEIRELVGSGGPFGSGDFAAFIVGIFGGLASIRFEKPRTFNGHAVLEYAFEVPQNASNYAIANSEDTIATAYSGVFMLDSQTGDLVQLTVHTAELPAATDACHATSTIEYQRMGIHGQAVLIPRETDLRTIFRDGTEIVGVTSYSSCHEYASRTVLRFEIPEAATQTSPAHSTESSTPAPPSPLALGLTFECRITTPLNSATPAGRPIEALLLTPLLSKDGTILAPSSARIHGRLVRLAEYKSPRHYFEADVRLDTVEVNGTDMPLYAVLTIQAAPPVSAATPDRRENRFSDFTSFAPRNVGAFFFLQKHLDVHQWDSAWLTTLPEASAANQDSHKEAHLHSRTPQQVSEKDAAQNFVLAIDYSQQATDLLNATTGGADPADNPRRSEVMTYFSKAIEAGQAADPDRLNDLYPGLGDKFKSQLLEALTLFVHSSEIQSTSPSVARQDLSRSHLLSDEWANWYEPLRGNIDHAVRSGIPDPSPSDTNPK